MTSHYVHVYATVRVKVGVEAADHAEAMRHADHLLFDNGFAVRLISNADAIVGASYAEEVTAYLVDEAGDPEFARSRTYGADHQPERMPR